LIATSRFSFVPVAKRSWPACPPRRWPRPAKAPRAKVGKAGVSPCNRPKLGDVAGAQGDLAAELAAYRAALAIAQPPAAADSANAEWQRDLWLSYGRMGFIAEQKGDGSAQEWWRKALETLSGMKRRGLFLSPKDEQVLARLTAKVSEAGR